MAWKQYPEAEMRGDENGNIEALIGNVWTQISSGGAAHTLDTSTPASEKDYTLFFFGDDISTSATAADTELPSTWQDVSLFDPAKGALYLVVTGSTAGDVDIDASRNGVDDIAQVHTVAYVAAGDIIIPLTDIGYAKFIRIRITDSSTTVGTVLGYLSARGA